MATLKERMRARKKRKMGTLRWNAKRKIYQVWRWGFTALGIPAKMWIRVKAQKAAKKAMAAGYKTLREYRKDVRQGKAGKPAPHIEAELEEEMALPPPWKPINLTNFFNAMKNTGAGLVIAGGGVEAPVLATPAGPELQQPSEGVTPILPTTPTPELKPPEVPEDEDDYDDYEVEEEGKPTMHACPCPRGHDFEKTGGEQQGIRPMYRAVVALGVAPGTATLLIIVNDPGTVDRLYINAVDPVTGADLSGGVLISSEIKMNSIPFDFSTVPSGTVVPWKSITDWGLGMKIGRMDLMKNDQFSIPLTATTATATTVEAAASLWGDATKLRSIRN